MKKNTTFKWLVLFVILLIFIFASIVVYLTDTDLFKNNLLSYKNLIELNVSSITSPESVDNFTYSKNIDLANNINANQNPETQKISETIVNNNLNNSYSDLNIKLKIPKINIHGIISPVGLTSDDAMESPIGPNGLGWYKFGPFPGEEGSAVIDGHYGKWVSGEGSIFDNLNKLKKGDKVYIEDNNGSTITFTVREIKIFNPEDDASDIFLSSDGKSHLNLITCSGTWIKKEKTFSKRLVVFTDKD